MSQINTRHAWRPVLKPIGRLLIAAHLALALQPLSVLAQDKGATPFNPQAQAQLQRLGQLNQTIEQAKASKAKQNQSPADKVSDKLARAEELVLNLKQTNNSSRTSALTTDSRRLERLQELRAQLQEIDAGVSDVRAEFNATRAELQKKNLPAEVLARHDQAVAQFEQRAVQLRQIAGKFKPNQAAVQAPGAQAATQTIASDEQSVVEELGQFFEQNRSKRKPGTYDPKKLPWSTPKPNTRAPAETKTAWFRNLYADQKVQLAQAGGLATVGGVQFSIPPEPGQAPQDADLAQTDETQLTPALRAKAAELNYNPVAIHNWVRNTIEWAPTAGAIQSAQDTFDKKRGNALDTASLLVALLRASGIPARYQFGTIDLPAAAVQNWVGGATKPEAALQILNQGGIAARAFSGAGQLATVRMEHVWVNAYVNWAPSRGSRQGGGIATPPVLAPHGQAQHPNPNAGLNAWIPLDASYKQYSYAPGMDLKTAVPLDANALLAAAQQGATVNEAQGWVQNLNQAAIQGQLTDYQNRLKTYIDSTPTGASSTVGDVIGKKIIPVRSPEMLAGGLPYQVVQQAVQASAVPAMLQHQFTYRLYASDTDKANDNPLISFTEKTSKLVGKRLTLSYVPATQADADTIASYLPKPHADGSPIQPSELPTSLPGYLIRLKAQINLDGQVVAQATQALQMGTDLYSTGGFTQLYDTNQWDLTSEESNVVGQATAIGISAGGISDKQLNQLKNRLTNDRGVLESGNLVAIAGLSTEQLSGDLLTATIWSWFAESESHNRLSHDLAGTIENPGLSYGLFHAVANPIYSWGVVRKVTFPGVNIDVGHVRNLTWAKDNSEKSWIAYNRVRGQYASSLEHAVLERFFNDPAQCNVQGGVRSSPFLMTCAQGISAVKAIGLAAQAGQKIFNVTREIYASSPNIVSDSLSAHSEATKDRIQQALSAGYEVNIHEAPITQDGWTGSGFTLIDPASGAGGYLIEGGSSGGALPSEISARAISFIGLGHIAETVKTASAAAIRVVNTVTFAQTWLEGILECYRTEIINSIAIIALGIAVAFVIGGLSGGTGLAPALAAILAVIAPQAATAAQEKVCNFECSKASNAQLRGAIPEPILDPEQFKIDQGFGPPTSPFDICACKDGSLGIYTVGQCGRIQSGFEFYITDHRWK